MTEIGKKIKHGEEIPGNVVRLRYERFGGPESLCLVREVGNGDVEYWIDGHGGQWDDDQIPGSFYPLTVVGVRPRPTDELRALMLPLWQTSATSSDEPPNGELARWVNRLIGDEREAWQLLKRAHARIEELTARLDDLSAPSRQPRTWKADIPEQPEGVQEVTVHLGGARTRFFRRVAPMCWDEVGGLGDTGFTWADLLARGEVREVLGA